MKQVINTYVTEFNDYTCLHLNRIGSTWLEQKTIEFPELFTAPGLHRDGLVHIKDATPKIEHLWFFYLRPEHFKDKKPILWTRDPYEHFRSFLTLIARTFCTNTNIPNVYCRDPIVLRSMFWQLIVNHTLVNYPAAGHDFIRSDTYSNAIGMQHCLDQLTKTPDSLCVDYTFGWPDHGFPPQWEALLAIASGVDVEVKDLSEMSAWYSEHGLPGKQKVIHETLSTDFAPDMVELFELVRREFFESYTPVEKYGIAQWLKVPTEINAWLLEHSSKPVEIKQPLAAQYASDLLQLYAGRIPFEYIIGHKFLHDRIPQELVNDFSVFPEPLRTTMSEHKFKTVLGRQQLARTIGLEYPFR